MPARIFFTPEPWRSASAVWIAERVHQIPWKISPQNSVENDRVLVGKLSGVFVCTQLAYHMKEVAILS